MLENAVNACGGCTVRDMLRGASRVVAYADVLRDFDYRQERSTVLHSAPEALAYRLQGAGEGLTIRVTPQSERVIVNEDDGEKQTFRTTVPVESVFLARSERIPVEPGATYEVRWSLGIRTGAVVVKFYDPDGGTDYAELHRLHARPITEERIGIQTKNGTAMQIQLVTSNREPRQTAVTMGPLTVRRAVINR